MLVADEKGFCLGGIYKYILHLSFTTNTNEKQKKKKVRGIASPESAAFITAIANAANHLDDYSDDKVEHPTINVEYEGR